MKKHTLWCPTKIYFMAKILLYTLYINDLAVKIPNEWLFTDDKNVTAAGDQVNKSI